MPCCAELSTSEAGTVTITKLGNCRDCSIGDDWGLRTVDVLELWELQGLWGATKRPRAHCSG